MEKRYSVAPQTRNNWLIDAGLFAGGLIASITGIYFLILPVGGYQGGRNSMYGVTILFERHTWEDLHFWFSLLMIAAAFVHIIIHWRWIASMAKRTWHEIVVGERRFNNRSRFNLGINTMIGFSGLITAISGLYLYFVPGGRQSIADPVIIFTRTTWDLIHTWAGIFMIITAVIHLAIHWRWVVKVTSKIYKSKLPVHKIKPTHQSIKS